MSDSKVTNYPDILGYITGGERYDIGLVQIATTIQPRIVRAGRPFAIVILLQNTADVELEVTMTLRLPVRDAKRQRGRFVTKAERLIVDLGAAEVGRVLLPISTLADTAISADYKIGTETKVKPKDRQKKAHRIRLADGGGDVNPAYLPDEQRQIIQKLRESSWFSEGTALRGSVVETPLTVMSGKVGSFPDLQPSWTSLWTMADYLDDTLLLQKYMGVIKDQVLPAFKKRKLMLTKLREKTAQSFENSGYALQELEIDLIARLLMLILTYGAADPKDSRILAGKAYNVMQYTTPGYLDTPNVDVQLPEWCKTLLRIINRDERAAQVPMRVLLHFAYDDLIKDGMEHAFERIEVISERKLDKAEQRAMRYEALIEKRDNGTLDFATLYFPLVMGGILAVDGVTLKDEKPAELAAEMRKMIDERYGERTSANDPLFKLANQLIEHISNKYSMNQW